MVNHIGEHGLDDIGARKLSVKGNVIMYDYWQMSVYITVSFPSIYLRSLPVQINVIYLWRKCGQHRSEACGT